MGDYPAARQRRRKLGESWEKSLMGKLTASAVRGLRKPGRYSDGDGLSLNVTAPDKRYWTFRYQSQGRERATTFGNADKVSLSEARTKAAALRDKLRQNIDPLDEKKRTLEERRHAMEKEAAQVSFSEAAERYIQAHRGGWHWRLAEQHWRSSLTLHVLAVFGRKPVGEVTVHDVLHALRPLWTTKNVTASRVRNRIELVLDYAKGMGWRSGENPAAWRGNLRSLLPPPSRMHATEHHAALDWREAPALFTRLRGDGSMAERCVAFLVLTAVRSVEARGCRWDGIDMEGRVWVIPAARMKGNREHRVPLSEPAMALLTELAALRTGSPLVFFSPQGSAQKLSDNTLKRALRQHVAMDITLHGFRSTFRDWCADHGKPWDLAETALAHVTGNAVARAYARPDLLEQRRGLMEQWADFLTRAPAVVVPFPHAAA
jgi:integrase